MNEKVYIERGRRVYDSPSTRFYFLHMNSKRLTVEKYDAIHEIICYGFNPRLCHLHLFNYLLGSDLLK